MTPTELRELDAKVAEKVMGWGPKPSAWAELEYERHVCGASGFNPMLGDVCGRCQAHGNPAAREIVQLLEKYAHLPRYSEDIAAAWQVVERMHEKRWRFLVGDFYGQPGVRTGFTASFEEHDGQHMTQRRGWAFAETAPVAICKAALQAVGQ